MNSALPTIENKILKYLNCIDNNDDYLLIANEEIKNIVDEIKDFSCEEILNLFKNLEKLDCIKIKFSNCENYLISLTEKGKKQTDNTKLKNSQNKSKNARFYTFLLSFLGSFLATGLALIFYIYFYKLC